MRIILSTLGLASLLTAGAVVNRHGINASHPQYAVEIPPESWSSAAPPENSNPSGTTSSSNDAALPAQPTLLDQVSVSTSSGVVLLPVGTVVEVVQDYGPNVIVFWNGHRFWLHREALIWRALESRSFYQRIAGTFQRRETYSASTVPKAATVTNNSRPSESAIKKTAGVERSAVPPNAQPKTWVPSPTMLSPRVSRPAFTAGAPGATANQFRPAGTSPIVRPAGVAPVAAPVARTMPVQTRSRTTVVEGPIVR